MLGTGHAVMQAQHVLQGASRCGSRDLWRYASLAQRNCTAIVDVFAQLLVHLARRWKMAHRDNHQPLLCLQFIAPMHRALDVLCEMTNGSIQAIVEEVDCTPAQKAITELNPGIYCFEAEWLWNNLSTIELSAKGEYYLTDMVAIAVAQGRRVETLRAPLEDVDGINTRVHLAQATAVMRRRILEKHMLNGVTIIDPQSTYIEDTVAIGQDSVIWPGTILLGHTTVGAHAMIGPHTQIVDSPIGDGCRVTYSVVEQAQMDADSEIGPFGHLRKGAHLGEGVHMGNFGEVKNSYLAPGTKMGHFSYIGDATVERNVNIAAGTITCNFDGHAKHQTHIGEGAFIGSDTLLVAPVTIGAGARTGAGSVVTKDVPAGALVYGVPAATGTMTDEPKRMNVLMHVITNLKEFIVESDPYLGLSSVLPSSS